MTTPSDEAEGAAPALATLPGRQGLGAGLTRAMPNGSTVTPANYKTFGRRFQIFQRMCDRRGDQTIAEGALALI
eukprot:12904769-Prorocentrum_lima.AAC.1